jgi:hypothetical protein
MDDSKIAVELTQDQFQVVLGCLSETVGQLQISTKIATDLVGRLTTEEFGQFTNSELDILILSLNTFIGQAQLKTKEIEKAKSQVQKGAALTATKDLNRWGVRFMSPLSSVDEYDWNLITGKLPKGLADKVLSTANDKIMQKRPSGG